MRFPQAVDDLPKRVPVVNGWSTHQEALLADGRLPETLILDPFCIGFCTETRVMPLMLVFPIDTA
jgi:hypothetical protein